MNAIDVIGGRSAMNDVVKSGIAAHVAEMIEGIVVADCTQLDWADWCRASGNARRTSYGAKGKGNDYGKADDAQDCVHWPSFTGCHSDA